ncbi:hypothetical protein GCM10009574_092750 [Streptomyces asiaticus]|uniref:Uncharacterized protein n=2 Tax=Streptomyces rhizosphaericus TaxID=114699 RepID=A0ABP4D438_9ACTN
MTDCARQDAGNIGTPSRNIASQQADGPSTGPRPEASGNPHHPARGNTGVPSPPPPPAAPPTQIAMGGYSQIAMGGPEHPSVSNIFMGSPEPPQTETDP